MKIKICGIRRKEDVQYLNECMPDYAGFVFADTRRKVTEEEAAALKKCIRPQIKVFGVFVNAPSEFIINCVEKGIIDAVQLHGDETETVIREIKSRVSVPVMKAVRVRQTQDILQADALPCDYLLFDTYAKEAYGGTGKCFAWEMIPPKLEHPYFLAGGLNESNIQLAMEAVDCCAVDVSGGVETDGVKDLQKMKRIVDMVKVNQGFTS